MQNKPELLCPAGSIDKLKVAISYGADAVYLAGQRFGLRSAAENFTSDELEEAVRFAHERRAKVYVVLNGFLHDNELSELPAFVNFIEELGVDGVIVSDLGVVTVVGECSKLPIHLSTQASCLNASSGNLWKQMGVTRLILGREVTIEQAGQIKKATGLEVELFVHGAMCMAYSGNCTISNFTQGRDSNRGGCAQSCRFEYSVEHSAGDVYKNSFFMSSKDLNGVELVPQFFEHGIDSLKIEGRMKSQLYAGTSAKVYREAIDTYAAQGAKGKYDPQTLARWQAEFAKVPNRSYTTGSLAEAADAHSVYSAELHNQPDTYQFTGLVREANAETGDFIIETRGCFAVNEEIEVVPFSGPTLKIKTQYLRDVLGQPIDRAKLNTLVRLPYIEGVGAGQIVRKVVCPQ